MRSFIYLAILALVAATSVVDATYSKTPNDVGSNKGGYTAPSNNTDKDSNYNPKNTVDGTYKPKDQKPKKDHKKKSHKKKAHKKGKKSSKGDKDDNDKDDDDKYKNDNDKDDNNKGKKSPKYGQSPKDSPKDNPKDNPKASHY
ncbi:hypothetical protein BJ684DRAFT_22045 [Piptocephalis cylindrospora]|uniref:Uncharacterized protein n=1 Tax=Piptocephalis cylindrospora TaxID=1907219 RepID=A0A4P9XYA9_9FUNG|nr:hypothetical protein BJ684DRAFT_22045 [Piptocephalis cylindrospora]|eukprot:RKP11395.1 hypothetical protein BJ684DRAFT_22045 [Piptocephalis cylindrospora]